MSLRTAQKNASRSDAKLAAADARVWSIRDALSAFAESITAGPCPVFTCAEVNSLVRALALCGLTEVAERLLEWHVVDDDDPEADMHCGFNAEAVHAWVAEEIAG